MTEIPTPANIQPYVDVLGVEQTIAFLLEFGGAPIYHAQRPQARSRVARLIGPDKAVALARASDRLPARVPLGGPWIARHYYANGVAIAEIARQLRASDKTVRAWLKADRAKRRAATQLSLF